MFSAVGLGLGQRVPPGLRALRGNAPGLMPGALRAVPGQAKSARPAFLKPADLNVLEPWKASEGGINPPGRRPGGKRETGVQTRRAQRALLLLGPFHGLMPGSAGHA